MRHGHRGFTLIEASATLAVMAVLLTTAMPGFQDVLQRRHTEGVASELATDLQFIRSEAVSRNQSLRVSFGLLPNGASCYVLHTGSAGACNCQAEGPAICAADSTQLKTVLQSRHTSVGANVASIVYDPRHGTSTPAATIRVSGSDGRSIHHVVNIMGRVRSCSPDGRFNGYRAC